VLGRISEYIPDHTFDVVARPCRSASPRTILVRGYSVMQGYLDDPEATAEAIDAEGRLHTGDLGSLDPGSRSRIVGRKKDMFIVGGLNAYPAEIKGFLLELPAVAQAAVVCRTNGSGRSAEPSW
jgi:acyl-CoA synthetase (AMP-forming)/AMP-acid ligase II